MNNDLYNNITMDEFVKISENIWKFDQGQISYTILKEKLLDLGFELNPNFTKKFLTICEMEDFENRLKNNNIRKTDINFYQIFRTNFESKSVSFKCDRYMIETLALSGNKEAIEILSSLIRWELSHGAKVEKYDAEILKIVFCVNEHINQKKLSLCQK